MIAEAVGNQKLAEWAERMAQVMKPDRVYWCDGSDEEDERLKREMTESGALIELNQERWPGCYLHRSSPNDVARVEQLTFICTPTKEEAGPTNNWMSPEETRQKVGKLFEGCMKGRTMYVVPYVLGPLGSPYSKFGVQVTDSPYVVANLRIMTRIGRAALEHAGDSDEIVYGMHSIGELDPEKRFICHLPQERLIMSYGSGYGGNALLSKKCFALRLGSAMAREQGWLAEHMLILGIEDPQGNVSYVAAAFPSGCGKTNLAMVIPPASMKGYKVWTVGDDIAWLYPDSEGRLRAINPEAGFFGIAPGTNERTNHNAMEALRRNTIFTNVALTPAGEPWWEGIGPPAPEGTLDWQGRAWKEGGETRGAHPNSRFTAPARQCPSISPRWEDPEGVPISAIIFGGRRSKVAPLVYETYNWNHGVYAGATMGSETTAAAAGAVGVMRRDPMAMLPFCGYNMGDYFAHWIEMGRRHKRLPKIFHVNWFRKEANGRFLWPGYGENMRVLKWIIDRVNGRGSAVETPIGRVPAEDAIDTKGLDLAPGAMRELTAVNASEWMHETHDVEEFFAKFGKHLPHELEAEREAWVGRLAGD